MQWHKLMTRRNSIFMDSMKLYGASHLFLNLGYDYRVKNFKIVNYDNYFSEDYDLYVNNLKSKYKKDRNFLDNIFNSGISNIKKFEHEWEKTGKVNLTPLSDARLKEIFDEYVITLNKLMAYLYTPLFAEKILTEEVSNVIKKHSDESSVNELLPILTSPEELSATQKEKIDFFKMARKLGQDKVKNNKLINHHLLKWAWLGDHNFFGDFWKIDDITGRIKNSKNKNFDYEIAGIKQDLKNAKISYVKAVKKWNLTRSEKNIFKLAKKYVYFRTFRLDALFYSGFLVKNLLSEIAERSKLAYQELMMLSPEEVSRSIIDKNNHRGEILKRKNFFAIILKNYKVKIYSGKASYKFIESEIADHAVKEIKGNPAFPGVVRGYAKIILNRNDFHKFKLGEILVTPMTTPDFVPLMKDCSAIITDEGGITCHAAIVSREMKKPCVIGTKIATKVLRNGDLVEVDANKGIVKILKR